MEHTHGVELKDPAHVRLVQLAVLRHLTSEFVCPWQHSIEPLTRLPSDEWSFSLGGEGCAGGIELLNLPPAGSEIFIDFVVTAGELTDNGDTVEPAP